MLGLCQEDILTYPSSQVLELRKKRQKGLSFHPLYLIDFHSLSECPVHSQPEMLGIAETRAVLPSVDVQGEREGDAQHGSRTEWPKTFANIIVCYLHTY